MAVFCAATDVTCSRLKEFFEFWSVYIGMIFYILLIIHYCIMCLLIVCPPNSLKEAVAHPGITHVLLRYGLQIVLPYVFLKCLPTFDLALCNHLWLGPYHTLIVARLIVYYEEILISWLVVTVFFCEQCQEWWNHVVVWCVFCGHITDSWGENQALFVVDRGPLDVKTQILNVDCILLFFVVLAAQVIW